MFMFTESVRELIQLCHHFRGCCLWCCYIGAALCWKDLLIFLMFCPGEKQKHFQDLYNGKDYAQLTSVWQQMQFPSD